MRAHGFIDEELVETLRLAVSGAATNEQLQVSIGPVIEKFRLLGNHVEEFGSVGWRTLARMIAMADLEALRRVAERDEGDYSGVPAMVTIQAVDVKKQVPVSIMGLFHDYIGELRRGGKGAEAERRWISVFNALVAFLGHDDVTAITRPDLVAWKERQLESLAPKTVRDTSLAALRAVFKWAEENGKISSNPASTLKVKVPKRPQGREKGLTDDAASALLRKCRPYEPAFSSNPGTRESAQVTAAKRWVPWLCAFTGARVSEMTQLRKEDIREKDGISFLRITPDAGSTKTGGYRDVPLHRQLVEFGFLDFVTTCNGGPLFYRERAVSSREHPSKEVSKRLAAWVRSLGVVSLDVDPAHGWRHRFKTTARDVGIDPRVIDAIQGHSPRTSGEAYGEVSLSARKRAIEQFPAMPVDP